jgi:hypothetical protein
MSANNSKPKNVAPVIVLREETGGMKRYVLLMLPALIGSVLFHAGLIGIFVVYIIFTTEAAAAPPDESKRENLTADQVEQDKTSFNVTDVDPAPSEYDTNIQYTGDRLADVSVPGAHDPKEKIGITDGDTSKDPMNLPNPLGMSSTPGQGGAVKTDGVGNSLAVGDVGSTNPRGMPLQGTFYGRSGATREYALRDGGGTDASEAAVTKGLKWLISQQLQDGSWVLTGGNTRPSAGTAFGLLPFLAAGKHHRNPSKDNPYDKKIARAIEFLKKQQVTDPKSTEFGMFRGGNLYDHGLATIAICEAFALSNDPTLQRPAQNAINFIVKSQSESGGGWGYKRDDTSKADMSVSGWQMMALKSGQMAGLTIPTMVFDRAGRFLDSGNSDGGFSYQTTSRDASGSSPRMSAVGLLCRQYMQNKGPSDSMMQKGVTKFLTANPPTEKKKDVYYYYYATQVLHHFGGEEWKKWNDKMREILIKSQDSSNAATAGSWSPVGEDGLTQVGGRLMVTSLNILTLEVYYRYLPLYYRDAGYNKDKAVQKAL